MFIIYLVTHRSSSLGSRLCIKDLPAENLLGNTIGIGPVVKGQEGRGRRCAVALGILRNPGTVMGLQRCWEWYRDGDIFHSSPPRGHCIYAALRKEAQYWVRPGAFLRARELDSNRHLGWATIAPSQDSDGTSWQVLANRPWSVTCSHLSWTG